VNSLQARPIWVASDPRKIAYLYTLDEKMRLGA
jgi:hypothetical protein